jgi:putative ABC transport system ATP-binding protein
MGSPVIRLTGISKSFAVGQELVTVLNEVDFCLESGECVALVGPSGSGKTTLLGICGLLTDPDSGHRALRGKDVTRLGADEAADLRFTSIGFCFQTFLLSQPLTAIENVMLPGIPRKLDFDPRTRAAKLLDSVGLGDRLDHLPSQLSGGEQQRVAFARALFADPPILLVDEPTANLDRETARSIADLLRRLQRNGSRSLMVATHDPLVADVCDRTVRLEDRGLLPG